jgi:hypothetical protein
MVVVVPLRANHLEAEGIYQEVRQESTKIMQTRSRRSFCPKTILVILTAMTPSLKASQRELAICSNSLPSY